MSVQPQPEFTAPFMDELIKERAGSVIPHDQANPALSTLDINNDTPQFAREIAAFFRDVGKNAK